MPAYRPAHNAIGPQSIYNQHWNYLYSLDDDRCPRQAFVDDLCQEIEQWLEEGDQLIIAIDANDNILDSDLTTRLRHLGLLDIATYCHGHQAPPTHHMGSQPINGLLVTSSLFSLHCGYLAFGNGPRSDHVVYGWTSPIPLPLDKISSPS